MAQPDAVFIYTGTYPSETAARADYETVKDLHALGAVGSYDASVVTKDDAGKVHVNKDETSTRHGAWGGAAAGALVGLLFPPAVIWSAVSEPPGAGSSASSSSTSGWRRSRRSRPRSSWAGFG